MEISEELQELLADFQEELTEALQDAVEDSPEMQELLQRFNELLAPLGYKMRIDWNIQISLVKKSPDKGPGPVKPADYQS